MHNSLDINLPNSYKPLHTWVGRYTLIGAGQCMVGKVHSFVRQVMLLASNI